MIGKRFRKIIPQLLLTFFILKKKKHVQFISQKIIRILLTIPNEEKKRWHYIGVKSCLQY